MTESMLVRLKSRRSSDYRIAVGSGVILVLTAAIFALALVELFVP